MAEETATPLPPWRAFIERNALWVSLASIAFAVAVVAVGVQVAPETFYDRFLWEDIYGPLDVDARQCRTSAACPGLQNPPGVIAKDGYTITSELTYGLVLAVMLYGIYVGLFRRYRIVADGSFILALLPWILLGPLARALEDANVFCAAGTDCTPSIAAYFFISPVIYLHIAVYVIAFMLLGVFIERRRHTPAERLSLIVASVLGVMIALFAYVVVELGSTFSALPPLGFVAASCLLALGLFHHRARQGKATMNLTVFVLGIPYALGCIYLIVRWLGGGVWSDAAWGGRFYLMAGAFIFGLAALVAATVWTLGRALPKTGVEAKWGALVSRVDPAWQKRLGYAGAALLVLSLLMAGVVPNLTPFFDAVPVKETLIPTLGLAGVALVLAFVFLHVGHEAARRPGILLVYALAVNVALVLGHMIDGLATWVALNDPVGFDIPKYSEKHPFSEFLLGYWNGFLFPFTKLVMVLVVVWLLDRETRDEPQTQRQWDERNLVGLVKMAIFVLGFAPGLRDVLRLMMGV